MFAGFVIGLREGLEAALVVGIVLGVLRRVGRPGQSRAVWAGVFAATLVSLAGGILLNRMGIAFEGRGEAVFEGLTMLLAAIVLTWMIFWMKRQGQETSSAAEAGAMRAASQQGAGMLFGLAFVAVLREGLETALFLTAAAFGTGEQTFLGAVLGLLLAALLGWAVYAGGRRISLRIFFQATGLLLILFAAGLLAHGIHELQEAALLPVSIEHIWDLSATLSEESTLGGLLKALFGYNANPSLLEAIAYVAYGLVVLALFVLPGRARRAAPAERGPAPEQFRRESTC
ncbi:MAG: FTR1 family iron permease [Anaerolineae bacterium]